MFTIKAHHGISEKWSYSLVFGQEVETKTSSTGTWSCVPNDKILLTEEHETDEVCGRL